MSANQGSGGAAERQDTVLMRLIQDARSDAFEELYDRYCDRAYRVARSICRDAGRAEEAVQETFIALWRNPGSYRASRGTVAAWLMTVARNRAIDVARRDRFYVDRRVDFNVIELHRARVDTPAQLEALDESEHMRGLLAQLPDTQREVIVLAFFGELTHAEIATHLGLPSGTVKGRMRLGLTKLRAQTPDVAA